MAERAEFIRRPVLTVVEPVPQELVGSSCAIQRFDHDAANLQTTIFSKTIKGVYNPLLNLNDLSDSLILFPDKAKEQESERRSIGQQRRWERQEERDRQRQLTTEQWQNESIRQARIAGLTGRILTEETKKAISAAQKGIPKSEQAKRNMSEAQGGLRNKLYPLVLRDGPNQEIAAIMQVEFKRVENLVSKLRQSNPEDFPPPTDEEKVKRKSRGMKFLRAYKANGMEYTAEQQYDFRLANELHSAGVITEDLTIWKEMKSLYEKEGRNLPESFAKQLQLEVFFEAVSKLRIGSEGLMALYNSLGSIANSEFRTNGFTPEEQFIFEQVMTKQDETPTQTTDNQSAGLREEKGTQRVIAVEYADEEKNGSMQTQVLTTRSIRSRLQDKRNVPTEEKGTSNKAVVSYLVEHHQRDLYNFAFRLCKNAADAEDLVQKAYLRLLSTSTQLIDPTEKNPRSYALSTISHIFIDRVRYETGTKDRKRPEVRPLNEVTVLSVADPKSDNPELHAEFNEVISVAKAEAAKTIDPQGFEEAFMDHYLLGFTHREIAERMQMPLGTVKTRLRLMKERTIRALQGEVTPEAQRSGQESFFPTEGKILKHQIEAQEEHIEDPAYASFLEKHGHKIYSYVFFNIGMDHMRTKEIVKKVEQQLREGNFGPLPQGQDKNSIYDFVMTIAADEISEVFNTYPQEPHMTVWGWASKDVVQRSPRIPEVHIFSADISSSSHRIAAMEINKV